ncbi:hypothetical protein JMJ77_0009967 [Colletotrichum scovillei]|uniref:Uncharacterized protein n=1 Tax=Colletotrichum scovillei TaxID=1209932 RepID=A0A9P7QTJ1_9PEZI|nr:hypothetical protein JMJ78_0001040 [Colletotrichum scovillei]KAG7040863.1 hypothetical protein JMJ77_0009967 [Colletotrichum scovillei]KAG7060907.1 hypothetical protein JMJ76_0009980 [Colletotrichum scovillei]
MGIPTYGSFSSSMPEQRESCLGLSDPELFSVHHQTAMASLNSGGLMWEAPPALVMVHLLTAASYASVPRARSPGEKRETSPKDSSVSRLTSNQLLMLAVAMSDCCCNNLRRNQHSTNI